MEKLILLSIAAVIFSAYVGYIWFKYGVQKSISASYYKLKGWRQVFFTLVLWAFSMLVMIASESYKECYNLMFFAGVGICFVGASPAIKSSKMTKLVHMIGAIGGILLGLAFLICIGQWVLVLNLAYIAIIIWCKAKNWMWWVETLMFFGILGGVAWS